MLSTQIEQALGNDRIATGYGDMLLMMFPDSAASKTYKERLTQVIKPVVRKSIKAKAVDQNQNSIDSSSENSDEIDKQFSATSSATVDSDEKSAETTVKEVVEQTTIPSDEIEQADDVLPDMDENKPTTDPLFHVVTEGENLYRISLRYNIKMQRLIEWNKLTNASDIFAGKKLRLTAPNTAREQE